MAGIAIVPMSRQYRQFGGRCDVKAAAPGAGRLRGLRRVAVIGLLLYLLCPPAWAGAGLAAEFRELWQALELSAYPQGWSTPDFELFTTAGEKVALKALRGKLVLINFWATWCPPCREEMPGLEALHREFGGRQLAVIAVNVSEDAETVKAFQRRMQLTFPLLLDPEGRISRAFGVRGLPATFLVGRGGEPLALATGQRDWHGPHARKLIGKLLKRRADARETQ